MNDSREQLRELARHPPAHAATRIALCEALLAAGETALSHACLPEPDNRHVVDAHDRVRLAHLCHRLGDQEMALAWMNRAIGAVRPHPAHLHFHALLLQFVGRLQLAERVLDDCLRQWPHFGSAALTRSRLRCQSTGHNHVDYLRELSRRVLGDDIAQASFLFALFKELDDLGEHDDAWAPLEAGNALMHRRNPYDEAADVALAEATMRYMDDRTCQRSEPGCVHAGPQPIFIVGMPRSGTTLLERMLGNHSRITPAGELADFFHQWCRIAGAGSSGTRGFLQAIGNSGRIDCRELGRRYLAQTAWRAQGRDYFTDKMPMNFQFAGLLHRALPAARIINVVRDPMAVCFSNFTAMLGDASPHVYEQRLLARFWLRHQQLLDHWHRVAPGAMLDITYEELVGNPGATLCKALAFCGLCFEASCADPVGNDTPTATPSSAQVRRAINLRGIGAWRPYAPRLGPMCAMVRSRNKVQRQPAQGPSG